MSLVEVIVRLFVVALLLGYLFVKHRRRAPSPPIEKQWPGHGIVVTGISERVQMVRGDYVSQLNSRRQDIDQRMGLLSSARRVVARLPFFRNLESQRLIQIAHESKTHFGG